MNDTFGIAADREQIEIHWSDRQYLAELHRTKRRVLRIEVKPSGGVVVFAPSGEDLDKVKDRVRRRGSWIFRQVDRVSNRPSITPERHFVSGETHLLLGKQLRLSIEQCDTPQVRIEGTRLIVLMPHVGDQVYCRRLVTAFYAITAWSVFNERLDALAPLFIRRGLERPSLVVRRMSKRWGSYTPKGRIVMNVDLVRASGMLIDYVICHELTHAFHPDHGKDWRSLLTSIMPDWENRKARLEDLLY
jgi:predicted metal-dependent hydrolase